MLVCGLGAVGREVTLLVSFVVALVFILGDSSVFECLAVFAHKHALALAHASRGGKCKRWGSPTRNEVEGGRRPVCTSAARKIGVPLVCARDGVP